jgi:hypothetical protein
MRADWHARRHLGDAGAGASRLSRAMGKESFVDGVSVVLRIVFRIGLRNIKPHTTNPGL